MAYVAITSGEITTGEPVSNTFLTKVKDDLADHETRLTANESAVATYVPIDFLIPGPGKIETGAAYWRVPFNINILGVRLLVIKAGASGTITIDMQKKSGVGAFGTILSSSVSAGFGSGDLFVSSGTLSVLTASAGDFIRLDISALQVGMVDAVVSFEFSKA